MENVLPLALFFIAAAAAIAWHCTRSRSILEQWAADNGFELLSSENRTFFRGPFFLTTSKNQTVYYVKVRDREGKVRQGWVRCGGLFLGLMSDAAEVRWEKES
jgi:hypothetical protein